MGGCIHACGAAAGLGTAHYHAARTGYQQFAIGNAYTTGVEISKPFRDLIVLLQHVF